jgi:hypothetical protein
LLAVLLALAPFSASVKGAGTSPETAAIQILPLPQDDTFGLDINAQANVSVQARDHDLRVIDAPARTEFNFEGFKLKLPHQGEDAFIAVWKKIPRAEAENRRVSVAQGDDKLNRVFDLPQSVVIPVNAKYASLTFLHTVRGAGEIGETLFRYTVDYQNGKTATIDINDGERVAGSSKPAYLTEGKSVYSGAVGGGERNLFLTSWNNPAPEEQINSITIEAVAKKIVPVLLGIAGHKQFQGQKLVSLGNDGKAKLAVDFSRKIKPISQNIFAMNAPYMIMMTKDGSGYTRYGNDLDKAIQLFRVCEFSSVRFWNRVHPAGADAKLRYDILDAHSTIVQKSCGGSNTKIYLNIAYGFPKFVKESDHPRHYLDFLVTWYADILDYYISKKQWPISHIEVFNEQLTRKWENNECREMHFSFYNALAEVVKKKYPTIKIGGTTEAWPEMGVINDFIRKCGDNTDFIAWHSYGTGRSTTPTIDLMKHTDKFAKSSQVVYEAWKKQFPDKEIEQSISEWALNYAAWKKPHESRQKTGEGQAWALSVMQNMLYDGVADNMYFWHFWGGGDYGTIQRNGFKRAGFTTFSLLNRHLKNGRLCAQESDNTMVEIIAGASANAKVIVLINKNDTPVQVELAVKGLTGKTEAKLYRIADKEKNYSESATALEADGNSFSLKKFSVCILIAE